MDTQAHTTPDATKRPRRLTDAQRAERQESRFDAAFVAAVRATENRTRLVNAYVIINPADPEKWGRVVITRGMAGGSVLAVAWLPDGAGRWDGRHYGRSHGGGYDMASAAMVGARFVRPDGEHSRLEDSGATWDSQLRDAGFLVIQAA